MQVDLFLARSKPAQNTSADFKVDFPNGIPGLHFWIVAEVCYRGCCQRVSNTDVGLRV